MCYNGACDGCSQCCDDTIYYNDDWTWDNEVGDDYYSGCPACNDTCVLQCQHCYMNEVIGCDLCDKGYIECTVCQPDIIDSSDVEPLDADLPF